jgi:hypothetical protein
MRGAAFKEFVVLVLPRAAEEHSPTNYDKEDDDPHNDANSRSTAVPARGRGASSVALLLVDAAGLRSWG